MTKLISSRSLQRRSGLETHQSCIPVQVAGVSGGPCLNFRAFETLIRCTPYAGVSECRTSFSSENKGLISTDRGTKTTLMRTIPRSILGRIQRICLLLYFKCFSARQPSLSGGSWTVHRMIVETKSLVSCDKHWKSAHRYFQPGFCLRGVQP